MDFTELIDNIKSGLTDEQINEILNEVYSVGYKDGHGEVR